MSGKLIKALRATPLYIWVILFTVLPLLLIVFYAFFEQQDGSMVFTLENFKAAITNVDYLRSMGISFRHAAVSTALCLLLGYPLAYILSELTERIRNFMVVLFLLPMWMNFIIRTYAMRAFIEKDGILSGLFTLIGIKDGTLIGTDAAIVIGMLYNFLPFMVLPIYTSLMKMDYRLIEAAQDLGAGAFTVFRRVVLPLTMPGIISGITMVFMPAVTTFVIPQMLNNRVMTVGSLIEYKFKQEVSATAVSGVGAALSMILMVLVIISMTLVNKFDKEGQGGGYL
jgi:spermidine/putrescine transport system permease protein